MGYSRPLALWMVSRWTTSPSSSTCDSCSPAASPASAAQARNAPRPPPPAPENARARSTSFSRLAMAWAPPGPVAARNSAACASRTSSRGQLVRLALGAALVQLAQRRERRADGRVPLRLRGEQVEPPAGRPEQEQLVVAEAEERRVQRAVQRRARRWGRRRRAGTAARRRPRAARSTPCRRRRGTARRPRAAPARRSRGRWWRGTAGRRRPTGRRATPRRRSPPGARRAVLHASSGRCSSAVHREQQRGERLRLGAPRRVGLAGGACRSRRPSSTRDARSLGRRPERLDPLVAGLPALLRVLVEHVGEHVVDPLHDRRGGAEVLADDLDAAGPARLPARPAALTWSYMRDVGAAEAVDGLLGVADHEQLAGLEDHVAPVARHAARARRGRRRSPPAAGRCPGTRRRAGSGSAPAAPPGRRGRRRAGRAGSPAGR